jgi:hypothetical protein
MGFARLAESSIRSLRGKKEGEKLGAMDRILSSTIGGALATWNQPIEVVRVEVRTIALVFIAALTEPCCGIDAIYGQGRGVRQSSRQADRL